MLSLVLKHPVAFFGALVIHLILIGIMVVSFEWQEAPPPKMNIVKATAVNEEKILKQIEALKKKERLKRQKEDRRSRKLKNEAKKAKKKRLNEEKRFVEAKKKREQEIKKRKQEEKRIVEIKEKQKLETRKQKEIEQLRIAEEKRRKVTERRRLEEELRLAQMREEQELIEEDARQRKADEKERKRRELEEQQRLKDLAAKEEKRRKAAEAEAEKQALSIVDKYKVLIKQKIERFWRIPASAKPGLKSTVSVRLIPGGDVLSVETVKSSGNEVYDRSVEAAVHKAVPLPLPPEAALFDRFRELSLEFRREDKK